MTNLYTRISQRFPADRSRAFATFTDRAPFSYADLEARSAAFANVLVARGVAPGDRVAVQADKSIDMLMLYLGTVRAGAIFLPLNTAYTAHELDYFMRDARPALFVCATGKRAEIAALAAEAGVPCVEDLDQQGGGSLSLAADAAAQAFATVEREDDDLAAILYTSGTTGRAKGAMLSHANLLSNALTLREYWRFEEEDVLLHALPIFHTHGLFVATNIVLAAGASMIFLPQFDLEAVLRLLPQASVMMGVPTFYIRLLGDARFTAEVAADMRLFISGSAPLSADIHREFRERTGHAILERYGMTETNMNTSNPYDGERVAGTVGLPLPGVSVRITDQDSGAPLGVGEIGMIEVSGPNVFQGYWQMPEKTAAEFHDGWFMTGDLGLVDQRGYVSIVGRAKDLIISGGYNIYPAEVESVLDELPMVHETAIIGVPHPDMGEGVVAVIVAREPGFADEQSVMSTIGDRLARFKQPRRIFFVAELPKNAMGKVQKNVLRDAYSGSFKAD
ncbi:MAG: malonyl-CoA synthase [Sphingobium sp.]